MKYTTEVLDSLMPSGFELMTREEVTAYLNANNMFNFDQEDKDYILNSHEGLQ